MKRTLWFPLLAGFAAVLLPLTAASQVPEAGPPTAPTYKYSVYGGFAYTSLNQVNESRYGLIGGKVMVTRDLGKYFAAMGSGDYYEPPSSGATPGNPGNPSVYSVLGGPEIHTNIWRNIDGVAFGELGVEHTGGEGMIPNTSFAGGFGGGLLDRISPRLALEATGDRVGASFSLNNNTMNNSPHRTWNDRATIGVVFRF